QVSRIIEAENDDDENSIDNFTQELDDTEENFDDRGVTFTEEPSKSIEKQVKEKYTLVKDQPILYPEVKKINANKNNQGNKYGVMENKIPRPRIVETNQKGRIITDFIPTQPERGSSPERNNFQNTQAFEGYQHAKTMKSYGLD